MSYISANYDHNPAAQLGTLVADPTGQYLGECVSYVKRVTPGLPSTSHWKKGAPVRGNASVRAGTVIATFTGNSYHGHTAIYESQDASGLNIIDQWIAPFRQPIHRRKIRFGAHGDVNNGDKFYVVE